MTTDLYSALSRRELLAGAAALGVGAAATLHASRTPAAPADLDAITLKRKLRYRTDSGTVFWWLRGTKYAQQDTELTPLFDNHTGTIQRVRQEEDGGFTLQQLEITIATAVGSDKPLQEWRNPLTGEVLPVRVRPLGPTTLRYRPDNSPILPKEIGGARVESDSEDFGPVIVGNEVFVSQVIKARVFREGRETPYVVNDLSHHHGSLQELTDPAVTMARATVSFAEATGWQSWMKMGDTSGTLTSRTFGAKAMSFEEMPGPWLAALRALLPDVAADPIGALDAPAARFDR